MVVHARVSDAETKRHLAGEAREVSLTPGHTELGADGWKEGKERKVERLIW